jgi:hypothetical protein
MKSAFGPSVFLSQDKPERTNAIKMMRIDA